MMTFLRNLLTPPFAMSNSPLSWFAWQKMPLLCTTTQTAWPWYILKKTTQAIVAMLFKIYCLFFNLCNLVYQCFPLLLDPTYRGFLKSTHKALYRLSLWISRVDPLSDRASTIDRYLHDMLWGLCYTPLALILYPLQVVHSMLFLPFILVALFEHLYEPREEGYAGAMYGRRLTEVVHWLSALHRDSQPVWRFRVSTTLGQYIALRPIPFQAIFSHRVLLRMQHLLPEITVRAACIEHAKEAQEAHHAPYPLGDHAFLPLRRSASYLPIHAVFLEAFAQPGTSIKTIGPKSTIALYPHEQAFAHTLSWD